MTTQVHATLINGVLQPDQPLPLPDQTRVRLTVEPIVAEALHTKRPDAWEPVDAIYHRLAASGRTFTDSADMLREDRDR